MAAQWRVTVVANQPVACTVLVHAADKYEAEDLAQKSVARTLTDPARHWEPCGEIYDPLAVAADPITNG
ncbi:hypothetical protein CKO11_11845 [Rhodobacter sp. TJ_12]|uniref:hypothetical protein n=1 Tax=Rhodobacter sp. TJ_12 TaxID=2029399 RepID=UPI001CBAA244|nr:hypothetical protein [Rhodobacter sp. TJ_12]MBZ4023151.1 hypothetical protein [Rhodobacter sp. TJ_12]